MPARCRRDAGRCEIRISYIAPAARGARATRGGGAPRRLDGPLLWGARGRGGAGGNSAAGTGSQAGGRCVRGQLRFRLGSSPPPTHPPTSPPLCVRTDPGRLVRVCAEVTTAAAAAAAAAADQRQGAVPLQAQGARPRRIPPTTPPAFCSLRLALLLRRTDRCGPGRGAGPSESIADSSASRAASRVARAPSRSRPRASVGAVGAPSGGPSSAPGCGAPCSGFGAAAAVTPTGLTGR